MIRQTAMVLAGLAGAALAGAAAYAAEAEWYVGERVVCVNNRYLDLSDAPELNEGATYTIKDILPQRRGHVGLEIAETPARDKFLAFDERRFRPIRTIARAWSVSHNDQTAMLRLR